MRNHHFIADIRKNGLPLLTVRIDVNTIEEAYSAAVACVDTANAATLDFTHYLHAITREES